DAADAELCEELEPREARLLVAAQLARQAGDRLRGRSNGQRMEPLRPGGDLRREPRAVGELAPGLDLADGMNGNRRGVRATERVLRHRCERSDAMRQLGDAAVVEPHP